MDTNRVINIIFAELSLETLKAQEEIERMINSSDEINNKTELIKKSLKEIVINDLMIKQLKSFITPINNEE